MEERCFVRKGKDSSFMCLFRLSTLLVRCNTDVGAFSLDISLDWEGVIMATLKREVLAERVRKVKPSGIRKFFDIINTMPDVISLGVGEPDFVTPEHIRQAGIRSIELGHTRYTSNYGLLELREEIAAMLHRRYGLVYDPRTEILVTVGVSEGVDLAMRTIIDPGDEVISPDPGYVAYEADIIFAGGVPVPVPTYARYDFGVRADEIAAAITPRTKMSLIGNPNNPTGAIVPEA